MRKAAGFIAGVLLLTGCGNPGAPQGEDSIESAILKGKQDAGITDNRVRGKDSDPLTKADPSAKSNESGGVPVTTDDRDR